MKKVKFEKELIEDIENMEEHPNVEYLRPITGGKGGDHNWLAGLEVGTAFLFRPTNDMGFVLAEAVVLNKVDRGVLIKINVHEQGTNQSTALWVLPLEFSLKNTLVEILRTLEKKDD